MAAPDDDRQVTQGPRRVSRLTGKLYNGGVQWNYWKPLLCQAAQRVWGWLGLLGSAAVAFIALIANLIYYWRAGQPILPADLINLPFLLAWILTAVAVALFLILVVSLTLPAHHDREKQAQIEQLIERAAQPVVQLRLVDFEQPFRGPEQHVSLRVTNDEVEELTDCRGVLVAAHHLSVGVRQWRPVREGEQLSWSQISTPTPDGRVTIAARATAILDVARTDQAAREMVFTVQGRGDHQDRGHYKVEIEVSGKKRGIPFVPVQWSGYLEYQGGPTLRIGTKAPGAEGVAFAPGNA